MIFKKGIATILSTATLLTAVSPCAFAEGNSKEETTKSMSTTGKVLLGAAGAVGLAATAGIIYYAVKKSPVKVETLKGKPIYEKYMELQKAVVSGKCEKVKNLLDTNKELDVKAVYSYGYTLLHIAAHNFYPDMCRLLIYRGADVNAKNGIGATPLHIAVGLKATEVCEALLKNGADIYATNQNGETPLDKAISDNNVEIYRILVKNNANLGRTPYTKAVHSNFDKKHELFFDKYFNEYGVKVETLKGKPIYDKYMELKDAVFNNEYEKVKNLLDTNKELDINAAYFGNDSLLNKAVANNNANMCDLLISRGAYVNAKNRIGATPLHNATLKGYADICELLINKGANVNSKQTYNDVPTITFAAWGGHLQVCKLLINEGADVNAKDSNGLTPLHCAVQENNFKMCELLLENGANVNAEDSNGLTPLHYAVQENNFRMCELLIKKRADVNAKESDGLTPLFYSIILLDNINIFKLLLEKDADVNAKDNNNYTPLHYAVQKNKFEMCQSLLKRGATISNELFNYTCSDKIKQLLTSHGA